MLENHERKDSPECVTEAEILSAIRYLDPDLERSGRDAGTVGGICVVLIAILTGVLVYICHYLSRI